MLDRECAWCGRQLPAHRLIYCSRSCARNGRRKLSLEQQVMATEAYLKGEPIRAIARAMGCSTTAVYSALDAMKCPRRGRRKRGADREPDLSLLAEPLGDTAFFWLGYLHHRGLIRRRKAQPELIVAAPASEQELLSHLNRALGGVGTIRIRKDRASRPADMPTATLTIRSEALSAALAKYGVPTSRTQRPAAPVLADDQMIPYWCGRLKGGGVLDLTPGRMQLCWSGGFAELAGLAEWIYQRTGLARREPTQEPAGFTLTFDDEKEAPLLHHLFCPGDIWRT